jgi:hypothetical protein
MSQMDVRAMTGKRDIFVEAANDLELDPGCKRQGISGGGNGNSTSFAQTGRGQCQ